MSLNSVSGNEFIEKMNAGYSRNQKLKGSSHRDTLMPYGRNKDFMVDSSRQESATGSTLVQAGYCYGRTASELFLQSTGRVSMRALVECAVRYISYEESDFSRVYAESGYSLKAQVELTEHRVYIEQKYEDGTYQAYEVNPLLTAEHTENPIEQLARDAWNAAQELLNDGAVTPLTEKAAEEETALSAFERMVSEFSEYVEQRMKEGPPKIQIGGSAFSEKEWENLLRKIDKDINAYKEELRERIRKQQEAAALKKAATGSAASEAAEASTESAGSSAAGNQSAESAGQKFRSKSSGPAISENEALEGLGLQRGSSFLARMSGSKKAPYSYLADENGAIVYNGVTFICDNKKNRICLGDMSDTKNVISIPLSKGGCLCVNRNSIGDLAKAINMFSPEDIGRILRAISQDSKLKGMEQEIENMII